MERVMKRRFIRGFLLEVIDQPIADYFFKAGAALGKADAAVEIRYIVGGEIDFDVRAGAPAASIINHLLRQGRNLRT